MLGSKTLRGNQNLLYRQTPLNPKCQRLLDLLCALPSAHTLSSHRALQKLSGGSTEVWAQDAVHPWACGGS